MYGQNSGVCPDAPCRLIFTKCCMWGNLPDLFLTSLVSSRSVEKCESCGGSKFTFSHLKKLITYTTACCYSTNHDLSACRASRLGRRSLLWNRLPRMPWRITVDYRGSSYNCLSWAQQPRPPAVDGYVTSVLHVIDYMHWPVIHRESKKQAAKLLSRTSLNINRFSKFFQTVILARKFAIKRSLQILPHLNGVATLPCEILMSENTACLICWPVTVF